MSVSRRIRTLSPWESVPDHPPVGRYVNAAGYVRLRWVVGDELVECYEHRAVMGNPLDRQVHHINHDRGDNRSENLRIVTTEEHGREHQTLPADQIIDLYATGLSTRDVASLVGTDAANVWRHLVRRGIPIRPGSHYLRAVLDEGLIRGLHTAGVSSRRIADVLGVASSVIDGRVRELGLPPHPPGRLTKERERAADRAIARLVTS